MFSAIFTAGSLFRLPPNGRARLQTGSGAHSNNPYLGIESSSGVGSSAAAMYGDDVPPAWGVFCSCPPLIGQLAHGRAKPCFSDHRQTSLLISAQSYPTELCRDEPASIAMASDESSPLPTEKSVIQRLEDWGSK
ncbi:hypothetical protein LLEC1_06523 [Akanthomyces lecanii]|uniref:Uncharacterized protein n=1 Tax=Cordyceps confragosa TaxID=2714763 RepID=A0A179I283_CORDF|nr:hypothetical protein LLEC1_06523 [Akanthomyces lecanii]